MPRLTDVDRARVIGQLQAGVLKNQVAALFGVSLSTISKLKAKFHITGDVRDRPRSGCPKKTTPQEDRFLTLSALRYHRLSSTYLQSRFAGRYGQRLSTQAIQNRLHAANLQSHRAARRPAMTALYHQARLMGCHPTAVCDQAGDQHEEEVPGCCGCVCFFHKLLRLPFVK
uniref:Transposase Tc1-like domain-containing protein n=1 Tax=Lates calcarifer TaxID=8187 RepID=A0A4W6C8R9_LATCA